MYSRYRRLEELGWAAGPYSVVLAVERPTAFSLSPARVLGGRPLPLCVLLLGVEFWLSRAAAAPEGCREWFSAMKTSRTGLKKQQWGGSGGNWELPSTSQPHCDVLQVQDLG